MSGEPPIPPTDPPTDVVDRFDELPPAQLCDLASYATELAEHKERADRLEKGSDDAEVEDQPEDLPKGVPSKASITVKEINGNRYEYWQWREGDSIKSKYKGPAGGEE